jgi:ATP-dependent helicase/nuclease subunit A
LQIPAVLAADNPATQTNPPNATQQINTEIALNLAADCGTLAHLYLEMIAKQGLQHWPADRMDTGLQGMRFWLLQRGHAKTEVEKQVPLIAQALKRTITSPQGSWILTPRATTQTELSITSFDENQQAQEHRIDMTFVENGTRWIIDFKLGLDVTEANANVVAQSHKPQLARYASLFTDGQLPIKTAVFFLSMAVLVEI